MTSLSSVMCIVHRYFAVHLACIGNRCLKLETRGRVEESRLINCARGEKKQQQHRLQQNLN